MTTSPSQPLQPPPTIGSCNSSYTQHFFSIPELVATLLPHLSCRGDLVRLMQTCCHLYTLCKPTLYCSLNFEYEHSQCFNMLGSVETIERTLKKNITLVKSIIFGPVVTAWYYNCMRLYLDNNSDGLPLTAANNDTDNNNSKGEATSNESPLPVPLPPLPVWFPRLCIALPLNDRSKVQFVPLPPLTNLTSYSSYMDKNRDDANKELIYLHSCLIVQPRMRQDFAILHFTPYLTSLFLQLFIQSPVDIHLLGLTLARLPRLETLHLEAMMFEREWPTLVPVTFFACSSTVLEEFTVRFVFDDGNNAEVQEWTESDLFLESDLVQAREQLLPDVAIEPKQGHEQGQEPQKQLLLPPIPRRQEPLLKLSHITVNCTNSLTESEIKAILDHCPNADHFL